MTLHRFTRLAALALSLVCTGAFAQGAAGGGPAWPSKPIKWIVPYTPGGITDNATRMVLQKVQEATGWQIVVENKPGANSMLGADLAAKSAPDGYTFLTVIAAHAANATLYAGRMPYDPVKSFSPVSLVGIAPLIMTATNNLPAKDMKELIAYAKANPGKISFGSSGVGAAAHLTTELFKQTVGVDMVHVPYKGTAPALQDLMGGNIQILVDTPSALMPHVRGGKIKAMGMFSANRLPAAPEVPTIAEARRPRAAVIHLGDVPGARRRAERRSSTAWPPKRPRPSPRPTSRAASRRWASSRSAIRPSWPRSSWPTKSRSGRR